MDETVKKSIDTNASLIQYVSIERIVHELKEIMETNPQVLADMTLLLKPVFNEFDLALRVVKKLNLSLYRCLASYFRCDVLFKTI